MNKEEYLNKIKKFKLSKKSKELFIKQVNYFFEFNNYSNKKYSLGDKILLSKNNLIHGSRAKEKELEIISRIGLVSSEFYSNVNVHKKKAICS